jgi:hypothetical protein
VDVKAGHGRGQKAGDEKNFQFQHDSLLRTGSTCQAGQSCPCG